MAAYKSLREQGYQPPHVDNSHELATKASSDVEIERGLIFGPKPIPEISGRLDEARSA